MKIFARAVFVLAISTATASAADMAVQPPAYKAQAVAVGYWTGFYIGAHLGWGQESNAWFEDASGTLSGPPGFQDASFRGDGILGGGQIGFNYQVQNWVLGIQADASGTDIKGNTGICFPQYGVGFNSCSTNLKSLETITARLGFVVSDRSLFYVKGGTAWAQHSYANPATGTPTATSSDTRNGWTVGAGYEYALAGPWSIMAEYDFLDFGTRDLAFSGGSPNPFFENVRENVQTIKFGINYRFVGLAK